MKILIIDQLKEEQLQTIKNELPGELQYVPNITKQDIMSRYKDVEIIITRGRITMDKKFFAGMKKLVIVGRIGAGMEFLDIHSAIWHGVLPINSGDAYAYYVAEHTLSLILALIKSIPSFVDETRAGQWPRYKNAFISTLKGKTIGIVGYGRVGKHLYRLLSGFEDLKCLIWDPFVYSDINPHFFDTRRKFTEFLMECDIISLHVPLTPSTFHLVNNEFLNNCKKGVIIVNTSRGSVVNTSDIIDGLKSGKIGGFAGDVFEYENPGFSSINERGRQYLKELTSFPNVIMTPHIAIMFNEAQNKAIYLLIEKIKKLYPIMKKKATL